MKLKCAALEGTATPKLVVCGRVRTIMIHTSTAVDNFYVVDVKNTPSRSKDVDEETEFVQRIYGA